MRHAAAAVTNSLKVGVPFWPQLRAGLCISVMFARVELCESVWQVLDCTALENKTPYYN
jgi:hypothetical protein